MGRLLSCFKDFFLFMDMKGTQTGFKMNGSPLFKSLFAGATAFLLYLWLAQILLLNIDFQVGKIHTAATTQENIPYQQIYDFQVNESQFRFAIGFDNQSYSDRMFDISLYSYSSDYDEYYFKEELRPCQLDDWINLVQVEYYYTYIDGRYCLSPNRTLTIRTDQPLQLRVVPCQQNSSSTNPCKYKQKLANSTTNLYYTIQLHYVNPKVDAAKDYPMLHSRELIQIPLVLSNNGFILRTEKSMKVQQFRVQTDQNVWYNSLGYGQQLSQIKQKRVLDLIDTTVSVYDENITHLNTLVTISYVGDKNQVLIKRKLHTVLDILKQIGSLLPYFVILVYICTSQFGKFEYLLEYFFIYNDKKHKVARFRFKSQFWILKYIIYKNIRDHLCCQPKWDQRYKELYEFSKQFDLQMDIRTIILKLQFFQRALKNILGQYKFNCLFLHTRQDLQQSNEFVKLGQFINDFRKRYCYKEYYEEIMKQKGKQIDGITDQQIEKYKNGFRVQWNDQFFQISTVQTINQIDKNMQKSFLELKKLAEQDNPVEKRIYQGIDERVKNIYLNGLRKRVQQQGELPKDIKSSQNILVYDSLDRN